MRKDVVWGQWALIDSHYVVCVLKIGGRKILEGIFGGKGVYLQFFDDFELKWLVLNVFQRLRW